MFSISLSNYFAEKCRVLYSVANILSYVIIMLVFKAYLFFFITQHIEKSDAELIAAMTIPKSITGKDGAKTIERQSGDYFKPRKVPVRLNDRLRRDGKQCMRLAQLQAYK